MSNFRFWPVVMWMYDVEGAMMKYKPSQSHQEEMRPFTSWGEAMHYGLMICGDARANLEAMPSFIVKVIEGERPDHTLSSPLRMWVHAIPLRDEGDN